MSLPAYPAPNETVQICPICPECFNISTCPLPLERFYSNYSINIIFLLLLVMAIGFVFWKMDNIWWAGFVAGIVTLIMCWIGSQFGLVSGTLLLIFEILIFIYTAYNGKRELGI